MARCRNTTSRPRATGISSPRISANWPREWAADFALSDRMPCIRSRCNGPRGIAAISEFAGHVGRLYGPVVAERHLNEQRLFEIPCELHPVFDERRRFHVEHDDVGLHARRNAADLVFKVHRMRRSSRREIMCMAGGQ